MIELKETQEVDVIKSIMTNPILFRLTNGKSANINDFQLDETFQYLVCKKEEEIVGLLQVKALTKVVLEVHIFLLPKYWGKKVSYEVADAGHKWVKEQGYLKTFNRVPANCIHVLKFLQEINYKVCGMIEKGIIHNNCLVTLFLYEFEV